MEDKRDQKRTEKQNIPTEVADPVGSKCFFWIWMQKKVGSDLNPQPIPKYTVYNALDKIYSAIFVFRPSSDI